jgi:hypothetical protein
VRHTLSWGPDCLVCAPTPPVSPACRPPRPAGGPRLRVGRSTLESIGSPHTGQHNTSGVDGTGLLRGRVVEAPVEIGELLLQIGDPRAEGSGGVGVAPRPQPRVLLFAAFQ